MLPIDINDGFVYYDDNAERKEAYKMDKSVKRLAIGALAVILLAAIIVGTVCAQRESAAPKLADDEDSTYFEEVPEKREPGYFENVEEPYKRIGRALALENKGDESELKNIEADDEIGYLLDYVSSWFDGEGNGVLLCKYHSCHLGIDSYVMASHDNGETWEITNKDIPGFGSIVCQNGRTYIAVYDPTILAPILLVSEDYGATVRRYYSDELAPDCFPEGGFCVDIPCTLQIMESNNEKVRLGWLYDEMLTGNDYSDFVIVKDFASDMTSSELVEVNKNLLFNVTERMGRLSAEEDEQLNDTDIIAAACGRACLSAAKGNSTMYDFTVNEGTMLFSDSFACDKEGNAVYAYMYDYSMHHGYAVAVYTNDGGETWRVKNRSFDDLGALVCANGRVYETEFDDLDYVGSVKVSEDWCETMEERPVSALAPEYFGNSSDEYDEYFGIPYAKPEIIAAKDGKVIIEWSRVKNSRYDENEAVLILECNADLTESKVLYVDEELLQEMQSEDYYENYPNGVWG